jgi:large subunit ribosomal protein LP0
MPLSKEKKDAYFTRLETLLDTYTKCFVVQVDNVGSRQMMLTRFQMRGTAEILMGKNTLIRKIISTYVEKHPNHPYAALLDKVQGNVGFVFTNSDLGKVKELILKNRVPAPARVGAVAPVDVAVPAGPTGCDPGQTNFFQVLQIPTKIVKGQIEITNPVNLVKAGEKVGNSEAALLTKLNIKPFTYGLAIDCVYDNGSIFPVAVLDISKEQILSKFSEALSKVAAISLQIGFPTQASIPHAIANAFNSVIAVSVQLEKYSFKEADEYRKFLANPAAFASAVVPAGAAAAAAPAAAAPAPVAKVEEVDALEGGMDMFGGGGGGDY